MALMMALLFAPCWVATAVAQDAKTDEIHKVTFVDGDRGIATQAVEDSSKATTVTSLEEGYCFGGWYADAEFTKVFNFDSIVRKDIIIYGKYTDISGWYYLDDNCKPQLLTSLGYPAAEVLSTTTTFVDTIVYVGMGTVDVSSRITTNASKLAYLVLMDGCTLNANAGITVNSGYNLCITAGNTSDAIEGTGALNATSNSTLNAGIGGTGSTDKSNNATASGKITINGGVITAICSQSAASFAAGIGGGGAYGGGNMKGGVGTVTINGGTVYAYSLYSGGNTAWGAGIGGGGGYNSSSNASGRGKAATVTINGGTVYAYSTGGTGEGYGAGIGAGGARSNTRTTAQDGTNIITITGGTVTAVSSNGGSGRGAGIGGGGVYSNSGDGRGAGFGGSGGYITITDGNVTAYASQDGVGLAAGIGGGYSRSHSNKSKDGSKSKAGDGGTVKISGGTVKAFSSGTGEGKGAGIGGGYADQATYTSGSGGTLTISDSAHVTAGCSEWGMSYAYGFGPGNGVKYIGAGGTLTIIGDTATLVLQNLTPAATTENYITGAATFTATRHNKNIFVDLGASSEDYTTVGGSINVDQLSLLDVPNLKSADYNYAKIYFDDAEENIVASTIMNGNIDAICNDKSTTISGYWGTFTTDRNVVVPADITVYDLTPSDTAKSMVDLTVLCEGGDGSSVVLAPGSYLLRNTESVAFNYFNLTDNEGFVSPVAGSVLRGATTQMSDNESGYYYYILTYLEANDGQSTGFYWQSSDGRRVNSAAYKAYLKVPEDCVDDEEAASGIRFALNYGPYVTGIERVNGEAALQPNDGAVYNLSGVRVANPKQRGVYIKNGKKYIVF